MKRVKTQGADGDMRPEYDFSGAVRGKYYENFQQDSSIVLVEPGVSAAFPTSAAVNPGPSRTRDLEAQEHPAGPATSESAEAAQAGAGEVREGEAARPSQRIRSVTRTDRRKELR